MQEIRLLFLSSYPFYPKGIRVLNVKLETMKLQEKRHNREIVRYLQEVWPFGGLRGSQ